jgi:hypothetical protein
MTFRELNRGKCKTYLAIAEASRKAAGPVFRNALRAFR